VARVMGSLAKGDDPVWSDSARSALN
jgi:hypothetical protein